MDIATRRKLERVRVLGRERIHLKRLLKGFEVDLITVYLAFREDLFGIRELTIVERYISGRFLRQFSDE